MFNLLLNFSTDLKFQENYLAWEYPGIGRSVIFLTVEGFLYFGIVVLVEMGVFRRIQYLLKGRRRKPETQFGPTPVNEEVCCKPYSVGLSLSKCCNAEVFNWF